MCRKIYDRHKMLEEKKGNSMILIEGKKGNNSMGADKFSADELTKYFQNKCDFLQNKTMNHCGECYRYYTCKKAYQKELETDKNKKIHIEIELNEEDFREICNSSMSIHDMYNTLKGRIYTEIIHAYNLSREVKKNPESKKEEDDNSNYPTFKINKDERCAYINEHYVKLLFERIKEDIKKIETQYSLTKYKKTDGIENAWNGPVVWSDCVVSVDRIIDIIDQELLGLKKTLNDLD